MKTIVDSFLYDSIPVTIESVKLDPDPEAAAQLQRKIDEAKRFLGEKYLLHPSQQVQRKAA
jgi:hypothetical protein